MNRIARFCYTASLPIIVFVVLINITALVSFFRFKVDTDFLNFFTSGNPRAEEFNNMKSDLNEAIRILSHEGGFQEIKPKKQFDDEYYSEKEKRLLEEISFMFRDAKADDMVEVTHLKNEPWHRTLKEKGAFEKIDYILAIDNMKDSLPYDEAKERMEEISEMHRVFGTK